MKKLFFALFLWMVLGAASAAECRITSTSCVDASPSKVFNGINVSLASTGLGCWTYQDTYECKRPLSINYCAALEQISSCWVTSVKCVSAAWDGTCLVSQRTYRCDDPSQPTPTSTVNLGTSYTITKDTIDTSQCDANTSNPLCYLASHTCVEGANETRVINGLPVTKDCWKWQDEYSCINPNWQSDCQKYIDEGCTKESESCVTSTDPIGCVNKAITYRCVTKKGETHTINDCSASTACKDGTCWDTSHPPDSDFASVVAGMEAARQAGVYGADSMDLFKGTAEKCAKGYGGLKNCCKDDPSGQTNNAVMMQAVGGAVKMGSKYVFDYMYQSSEYLQAGMAAMGFDGIEMASKFGSSFEMYGISYSFGAGALAAGETATGAFGQTIYGLGNGFAFDPYSFAAAVAIQVIMELMACEPEEQQLGMHKGANLCKYVGDYCSNKVFGVCLETTQAYCCYNSKLAKIINEQGKPQIGKGWGSAESPQCDGFTTAEFQKIDFSKIDMSEFVGDIMAATELPDVGKLSSTIAEKMKNVTTNPGGGVSTPTSK